MDLDTYIVFWKEMYLYFGKFGKKDSEMKVRSKREQLGMQATVATI